NPKVIDVPNPSLGRATIDAVAQDGIQLKVRARVTVRTNIRGLVGGATEETVIARVGEGIVTAIGSAKDYKDVLENPDHIPKAVADALRSGHFGVLDYYKLKNIQADTTMREAIAKPIDGTRS